VGQQAMIEFKVSHFERQVILWGVRWYVAYPIGFVANFLDEREKPGSPDQFIPPGNRTDALDTIRLWPDPHDIHATHSARDADRVLNVMAGLVSGGGRAALIASPLWQPCSPPLSVPIMLKKGITEAGAAH
jgi:hypothetical protein